MRKHNQINILCALSILEKLKAGCYIGEVLSNNLMFADDTCFVQVYMGCNVIDVDQFYVESQEIIFNCYQTVCMTFETKTAKSTAIPLLTLGV